MMQQNISTLSEGQRIVQKTIVYDSFTAGRGERETTIINIVNQKGGCGKTTTSINLAALLATKGFKVVLIDTDPQAQTGLGLGVQVKEGQRSLYEVLVEGAELGRALYPTEIPRLEIVPGSSLLSGAQLDLASFYEREYILKRSIESFLKSNACDYIIIDCSPTLNLITINALVAAKYALIPFQTHYYSLEGIKELLYTIDLIKMKFNQPIEILGILATLFDRRSKIFHHVLNEVRGYFKDKVFDTVIHNCVKLCEAPMVHKPIHVYAPKSSGAEDYKNLTEEVIKRTKPSLALLPIAPVFHWQTLSS